MYMYIAHDDCTCVCYIYLVVQMFDSADVDAAEDVWM